MRLVTKRDALELATLQYIFNFHLASCLDPNVQDSCPKINDNQMKPLYFVNLMVSFDYSCFLSKNLEFWELRAHLSTAVAWREKICKHFVFYKYFSLVLGLLKSRILEKVN